MKWHEHFDLIDKDEIKCIKQNLQNKFKDAMPVSFISELFTSYISTIFRQWNLLP